MSKTLQELFVDQFRLCKLTADETVCVISELGRKTAYVEAAVAAARQLGAAVLVVASPDLSHPVLPPYHEDGREIPALLASAGESDLVVDVTVGGLVHSDVRTRITGQGKRMFWVDEPADVLERLTGSAELRTVVEQGGRRLKAGKTLHVSSAAGTDFTVDLSLEDLPVTQQWGYVDEPGRWDHWPSGFVACFPRDRSGQGTIVLQPGDALLPWQRYVRDEVALSIKDGFIVDIKGSGTDALVMAEYFEAWNDPAVYALSHVGWGVMPQARWSAFEVYDAQTLIGQELRSTAGNFMWSTGVNRFVGRETHAHLDIPMRGCTVEIDEVAVVRNGQLVTEGA